jgi:broad specificity phosphatase PhoE
MKVLFVRHGESQDDVEDRYGGWSDFDLTDKGKEQIAESAEEIKKLSENFQLILTSPLKRALQSAEVIGQKLNLQIRVFEYVKERNKYGILSGMVKSDAKSKYPDLVADLDNNKYVIGSERHEDILERAKKSLELLEKIKLNSVIVVTHGNFLIALFEISGKKLTKKDDGCFVLCNLSKGKLKFIKTYIIEYE